MKLYVSRGPADHRCRRILQTMVSGIPNVLDLRTRVYSSYILVIYHIPNIPCITEYIDSYTNAVNYMVRGACAPLMDSECHSMKTLVNAIDYACRLREGPGNKNISLGSVLKLLLVSHIAVVFAALLVVAVTHGKYILKQA